MKFEKLNSINQNVLKNEEMGLIKGGRVSKPTEREGMSDDTAWYDDSGNDLDGNPIGLDHVGTYYPAK